MSISTYGDFDFQTVVDAYDPKLADLQPHHQRHGLSAAGAVLLWGPAGRRRRDVGRGTEVHRPDDRRSVADERFER